MSGGSSAGPGAARGSTAAGPAAVLIGPPGSGKSTVGRLLARRLGTGFLDTDARIEQAAGKPVSEIFIEDGEEAFRALERDAVASALSGYRGVVAVGGGAVMDPGTRRLLDGLPVVYLETGFAELAGRVGLSQARPLLLGNPRARLRALLEQRLPVYAALARLTVTTDGRRPDEIAAEIQDRLAGGAAGAPGRDQRP